MKNAISQISSIITFDNKLKEILTFNFFYSLMLNTRNILIINDELILKTFNILNFQGLGKICQILAFKRSFGQYNFIINY